MAEPLRRRAARDGVALSGRVLHRAVFDLLESVALGEPERIARAFFPHEISGGQRQRVAIALALACRPQLLIADEPTTALDVTTQAEILKLLDGLVRDNNMALLFIGHDLPVVARVVDRVVVLQRGGGGRDRAGGRSVCAARSIPIRRRWWRRRGRSTARSQVRHEPRHARDGWAFPTTAAAGRWRTFRSPSRRYEPRAGG